MEDKKDLEIFKNDHKVSPKSTDKRGKNINNFNFLENEPHICREPIECYFMFKILIEKK